MPKTHSGEKQSPPEAEFIPFAQSSFCFECHKDVPCFNECCAKLRLVLTPYDILRIKHRLSITSSSFLEKYTDTLVLPHNRFPMVRLRMQERRGQICPFVTQDGCAIYEDRPVACRIYPLGRASTRVGNDEPSSENFFIVKEPHCLGFEGGSSWSLAEWLRDQGVEEYDAMNREWLEVVTSPKSLRMKTQTDAQLQVFFTVSYDLDKFRALAFEGRFFDRFQVDDAQKDRMRSDDAALMRFGFSWLKFSLFGERVPEINMGSPPLP